MHRKYIVETRDFSGQWTCLGIDDEFESLEQAKSAIDWCHQHQDPLYSRCDYRILKGGKVLEVLPWRDER